MNKKLPRGLRNRNPLNIRKSSVKWQGMSDAQGDSQFVIFISNEYGYRAAFKILHTYMTKYNLCTITEIVKRWAPSTENDTKAYIRTVHEKTGIGTSVKIYWSCKEDMVKLVSAMSYVENGVRAQKREVEDGYRLAFGF